MRSSVKIELYLDVMNLELRTGLLPIVASKALLSKLV
jgi:hypothetical protein